MNMPGFTAEASLYKTTCQFAADHAGDIPSHGIIPQAGIEVMCSDDGRVCFVCNYTPDGVLLYCDMYILPA